MRQCQVTIIISGVVVYLDVCVLKLALFFSLSFYFLFFYFYALSLLFYVYSQVFLRQVTFKHTTETLAAFNISYSTWLHI